VEALEELPVSPSGLLSGQRGPSRCQDGGALLRASGRTLLHPYTPGTGSIVLVCNSVVRCVLAAEKSGAGEQKLTYNSVL
jgi:hypothetical protein